jgi:allantoinase
VRQLCRNPARHFLLDDRKGSLEPGKDADFVVLKPERYAFDPSTSLSAVQWSSFEGMEFSVQVMTTYCRGVKAYELAGQAAIRNEKGFGQFLQPAAFGARSPA